MNSRALAIADSPEEQNGSRFHEADLRSPSTEPTTLASQQANQVPTREQARDRAEPQVFAPAFP